MVQWQVLRESLGSNDSPERVAELLVMLYARAEDPAGTTVIPVPVHDIAKRLEVPVTNDEQCTDGAIDSSLAVPQAVLPVGEERALRFSLAHLLGHLFLHAPGPQDDWRPFESPFRPTWLQCLGCWLRFRSTRTIDPAWVREFEAHRFAAALLLPAQDFVLDAYHHGYSGQLDQLRLARCFDVSPTVVAFRLRQLKMLP